MRGRGFLWIQNENLNFSATKMAINFDMQCMMVDAHSLIGDAESEYIMP